MNNKLKILVKNILFFPLLLLVSANIHACKKENQKIDIKKTIPISNDYSEVKLEKIKIKEDSKNIIYQLRTPEIKNVFLNLDIEKEIAILEINNQKINTDFNFTYDTSTEDAINEIKLLINNENNLIFLFPVATEEYLTFQILKYNKKSFSDSNFYFETHEDIRKLYMNSKATLSEQNNLYILKIDSHKFKGSFQSKNLNMSNTSNQNNDIFNGIYNICIDSQREDSIKSETCYEISIVSNSVTIDANTSICKGNYTINRLGESEVNLKHKIDLDCSFRIKKNGSDFFVSINNSKEWYPIKKDY